MQKTRISIDQPKPYLTDEHIMRRRNVFQGDSHVLYEKHPMYKSRMSKSEMLEILNRGRASSTRFPIPGSKPFSLKGEINANAELETQLVGMGQHLHDTLEGKVDLKKVRDIRRSLEALEACYLLCFRALERSGAILGHCGTTLGAVGAPLGRFGSTLQPF